MYISLLVLYSSDIERTKKFYELIGLNFKQEKHGNGPFHYAAKVGDSEMVLEIYPSRSSKKIKERLEFSMRATKFVRAVTKLERYRGCIVADHDKVGWNRMIVKDPDGRIVELKMV